MSSAKGRSISPSRSEFDSLSAKIKSLEFNMAQVQHAVSDHEQRFDTLQTRLWKRLWFRIDGWPGIKNLNAEKRSWRPWHR